MEMKKEDINIVKFIGATLLLIFGRRPQISSSGHLTPYSPKEAYDAIETIAKSCDPKNSIEDII